MSAIVCRRFTLESQTIMMKRITIPTNPTHTPTTNQYQRVCLTQTISKLAYLQKMTIDNFEEVGCGRIHSYTNSLGNLCNFVQGPPEGTHLTVSKRQSFLQVLRDGDTSAMHGKFTARESPASFFKSIAEPNDSSYFYIITGGNPHHPSSLCRRCGLSELD